LPRPELLNALARAIGEHARPFLETLPEPELRYLAARPDLRARYAAPGRGPGVMLWEMSTVARGEQALAEIVAVAPVDWPQARALDIGCGDAGFVIALARRGARAHGLDNCPGNLDGARLRGRAWQIPLHLALGAAGALPHRDASFDVVTCGDVLEHVPDRAAALREIARVLKPGGLLWLAAPTRFRLPFLWRDPHYGFFGVALLPRRAAAWYLARIRRALPSPNHYEVERLPTYGETIAALRRLQFEILAGEYRQLAALREPTRIQNRWKKALVRACLKLGLRRPTAALLAAAAELTHPIRLVCRKGK